jgi:hypothetical protein
MVTTTELNRRGLPYFTAVGADGTTEGALLLRDASGDTATPQDGEPDTLARHLRRIYRRLDALEGSLKEVQSLAAKPGKR